MANQESGKIKQLKLRLPMAVFRQLEIDAEHHGDRSTAEVHGKESVAVVTGLDSKARGCVGSWLVLTERDDNWHILGVKAICIDGKKYNADTWYTLKGGRVVRAEP